ncbi:MAG: hypothetical protein R2776_06035 [Flavobacteriaceae bacterium]|nr:hypothetical protein [Flavobacteriaceae bacterium]
MKAIISILLSFLILLSSSGLAYAKHYCGPFEMLSKITLGEEALSCGMAMEKDSCGDEKQETHSCCSNKYVKVTTDDHFNKVSFDFNFQGEWVFIPVEVFEVSTIPVVQQKTPSQNPYRPPPLKKDFQVLYETFLI